MRSGLSLAAVALSTVLLATACSQKAASLPAPEEPTADSVAYFCGMNLFEHPGPKGQVFVAGRKDPLWFSSARDAIAFVLLPEQPQRVVVAYVNDMGRATHWDRPDAGAWVRASDAWYAIGSRRAGGMGADEAVPFGAEDKAKAFAAQYGGRVVDFADIPQGYVLGSGEAGDTMAGMASAGGSAHRMQGMGEGQ